MTNSVNGKGVYLYDRYGKVLGVKPEASAQAMQDNYSRNMTQHSKTLKGETWIVWGNPQEDSVRTIDEIAKAEPGLLISLFLDGNLTVSELKIGVLAAGGKDFNVEEDPKTKNTIVTYKDKDGDKIELRCSTEACKSQTDKKTQTNGYDENIIQGSTKSEAYDPYFETSYSWNGMSQISTYKPGGQEALQANNTKKSQNNKSASYVYEVRIDGSDAGDVTYVVPNPNNKLNWKEQCDEKKGTYKSIQNSVFNKGELRSGNYTTKYVTAEELSVEQIINLCVPDARHSDNSNTGNKFSSQCLMPTSEIEKGLSGKVEGLEIKNIGPIVEGGFDVTSIKFTYKGIQYNLQTKSYEDCCSYINNLGQVQSAAKKEGVVNVSNAQQLRSAMEGNKIIILNNDIDLTGVNWTPLEEFSGAICGQGYTIKNLTVTTDKENAGFVGVLTGVIQDVNFENAKIVNTSGELKSSSGVIAGRMEGKQVHQEEIADFVNPNKKRLSGGFSTQIKNVMVKNSTVTGGANTGGMVGDANKGQILDCNVAGCKIKGSYANGGAIGHSDAVDVSKSTDNYYNYLNDTADVADTIVEGGVFAGGAVGSADNNFYTTTYWKGGIGDGYTSAGARTLNSRINMNTKNVTVKGEEGVTLAAGGIFGRMNAPDSDTYESGKSTSWRSSLGVSSSVSGAYAVGDYCGWFCEVDPETGKVIKDCDAPGGGGGVGRAGTNAEEIVKINAGQYVNIEELYAKIDSFAQINNLSHYKNFEHVYQDSKGNLYWGSGDTVMCNTYVNAIDAYKLMKSQELSGKNISMSLFEIPWLSDDDVYSQYGYCSSQAICPWDVNQLLSGLDAVEVYGKRDPSSIYNQDGLIYGKDVPYEYCYKTADGKWHKLTMTSTGAKDNNGESLASVIYTYNSVEEYINNHQAKSLGELDKVHTFVVEDITAEEAIETFGGLTGQPPHNQGFTKDGIDGYVEEIKPEKESDLTGITKVATPANATLQDYKDMLVLTNFLRADVYRGMTVDTKIDANNGRYVLGKFDRTTGEYKGVFSENPETEYHMIHGAYNSYEQVSKEPYKYEDVDHLDVGQVCPDDESCYINWYFIPGDSVSKTVSTFSTMGGVELTESNLDYYKDKIQFYDKNELVAKVLEKLKNESWKMVGQGGDVNIKGQASYSPSEPSNWVKDIITAITGSSDFTFTPSTDGRFNGLLNYGFAHAEFNYNGTSYCIPLAAHPAVYDESQIFTTEDVDALRPYLSDEIINDTFYNMSPTAARGSYFFAPLYSENGKIESWLYLGNLQGLLTLPCSAGENGLNSGCIPYSVSWSTNGPENIVKYIKTHDIAPILENWKDLNHKNADGTFGVNKDLYYIPDWNYNTLRSTYGLSDEVISYYFSINETQTSGGKFIVGLDSGEGNALRYNCDPDMDLPIFQTLKDFENYIKSHDLNAEYYAAKAKKEQIVAQREAEAAEKAKVVEKEEREAHSKEFIEKFTKQFVGYEAASSEFTSLVAQYKAQYINGELSKVNFDGLVYKAFDTVKTKHMGGEEAPTVIMTAAEYKSKLMNSVSVLGLKYDENTNAYYKNETADYITVQKYFLWNPFANNGEGDVLWYQSQFMSSTKSGDQGRVELINKLNAAYAQGLNFTTDPDICTDSSGNVYKYNKVSGNFVLKK